MAVVDVCAKNDYSNDPCYLVRIGSFQRKNAIRYVNRIAFLRVAMYFTEPKIFCELAVGLA